MWPKKSTKNLVESSIYFWFFVGVNFFVRIVLIQVWELGKRRREVKFVTLVLSQRYVPQVQKVGDIIGENYIFY
jgi:hypothetical protein